MFKYSTKFPISLIKSNDSYWVNYNRETIIYDPSSPILILEFTDEWEKWKLNISDLYYIDAKTFTISFKSLNDYTMFNIRWK